MASNKTTPSFPRRRESSFGRRAGAWKKWIPAFAGMTLFFTSLVVSAEVETAKPPIPLTEQQEALYKSLLPELRCLVCQNESLAESQASLAADLRYEVRGQVAKGGNEAQIKKYLTDRYSDFILYKPPLAPRTAFLWFGPFVLLLLGLVMLFLYARRTRAAPAGQPAVDAAAIKKILEENP
jgi:cytochrome c-type biogenesis protein CcmH